MKVLHVIFDDAEFKLLEEAKKDRTWRAFLLELIKKEDKNGKT